VHYTEGWIMRVDASQLHLHLLQVEEADLAAAVQTRRAGKAENEIEILRAQLAEAQREAKELAWQIKMTFDPSQPGTGSGASGLAQRQGAFYKAAGMLDILGCGANFSRK